MWYVCLEEKGGKLMSRRHFVHPSMGEFVYAPDWNPDPGISCGRGMHIVDGHPLNSQKYVRPDKPSYFEVEIAGEAVPSRDDPGQWRVYGYKLIRRINERSPEFQEETLLNLFFETDNRNIKFSVLKQLIKSRKQNALARIAMSGDTEAEHFAVSKITNPKTLAYLAINAGSWQVRHIVANQIKSQKQIAMLAEKSPDYDVRLDMIEKLIGQKALMNIAIHGADYDSRISATCRLTNQLYLFRVAIFARGWCVRYSAMKRITEQKLLARLVIESPDSNICLASLERITDEDAKMWITKKANRDMRYAVTFSITDEKRNDDLAIHSQNWDVRNLAVFRTKDIAITEDRLKKDPDHGVRNMAMWKKHSLEKEK
jgi:hypothetical protein